MRKLIATLFAAIFLIPAFGQVDSLKNASLIGQASRNQKVGQGFQIGFVGSSDDTCQINTKLQIVPNAGLGKLLYSDGNGFGTWSRDILIGENTIRISSSDGLTIGINDSAGARNAFVEYADDTAKYALNVSQFGISLSHQHQSQIGHYDGLLSIVHYENSLNRAPGDGRILSISNTNQYNGMSITDTATGLEISKFENTDSTATVLVNYNSEVQFKSDAMLGVYSDTQKWRIDSNGVAYLDGISITDGTQGEGKVLTSDANGNASWSSAIYGSYYDTLDQVNKGAAVENFVHCNSIFEESQVSKTNDSTFTISVTGVYEFTFTAQVSKTDVGTDDVRFYLRKNGDDLPFTSGIIGLANANATHAATWMWQREFQAGDTLNLLWQSDDVDLFLDKVDRGTTPNTPAVPSVTISITKIK